jgi:hypothetical protein
MSPLAVTAIGPATLGAFSALRPVQALPVPPPNGSTPATTALSIQDLAQTLFQRTLQTATAFPVAEPAAGSVGLIQEATASLLASLNAPQAAANPTPAPAATTNPAGIQATAGPSATDSTAPAAAPPATVAGDVAATQDAFATSSSQDFALQTALRFGAGVPGQGAPPPTATDMGVDLVRDAARVPRLENLQPHAGGPGPEAFAQPQTPLQRILRDYQTVPAAQSSVGLDLLA